MKKYLGLILFIAVHAISQINGNVIDIKQNVKECLEEAKVPKDLQNIEQSLINNPMGLLNNPQLKCFSACLMRKKGNIKDGRIDTQQQLNELLIGSPEAFQILKDIVASCANIANQNEDECEVADQYVQCIIKNVMITS